MPDIESRPLAPPNARTRITGVDRAKVYNLIGKQLDYLLNGGGSYYPDGGRKSAQQIGEDIERLRGQVLNLKGFVDDPASILDGAANHLREFRKGFSKAVKQGEPRDAIALSPDLTPWSSDENTIDGDRYQQTLRPDVSSIGLLRDPRNLSSGKANRVRRVSGIRDQIIR